MRTFQQWLSEGFDPAQALPRGWNIANPEMIADIEKMPDSPHKRQLLAMVADAMKAKQKARSADQTMVVSPNTPAATTAPKPAPPMKSRLPKDFKPFITVPDIRGNTQNHNLGDPQIVKQIMALPPGKEREYWVARLKQHNAKNPPMSLDHRS